MAFFKRTFVKRHKPLYLTKHPVEHLLSTCYRNAEPKIIDELHLLLPGID
jgi:hypothetical protein